MLFLWLQQSLLTVLKESFKVYKAISEGLINLADRFFEMEYLDAHKGLEVYKESIVANDRLQQYYQQVCLLSFTYCCACGLCVLPRGPIGAMWSITLSAYHLKDNKLINGYHGPVPRGSGQHNTSSVALLWLLAKL